MNSKVKNYRSAIFLHIQKTAGSSIVDIARKAYGSDQVVSHGDYLSPPKNLDSIVDISRLTSGSNQPRSYIDNIFPSKNLDSIVDARGVEPNYFCNRRFISGHFGYDFAKVLMKTRYSFTFLRDPTERILSFYYFCKTRDPNQFEIYALAQQLSLNDFLTMGLERPGVKACIWNNQAWQLANGYGHLNGRNILSFSDEEILALAIQHLDDFSYIGFAETFEKDRDHILKALRTVPPKEKIVSNANPNRPTANDLPLSSLKLLNELTHLDSALYNIAWRRKSFLLEKPFKLVRKLRRNFLTL